MRSAAQRASRSVCTAAYAHQATAHLSQIPPLVPKRLLKDLTLLQARRVAHRAALLSQANVLVCVACLALHGSGEGAEQSNSPPSWLPSVCCAALTCRPLSPYSGPGSRVLWSDSVLGRMKGSPNIRRGAGIDGYRDGGQQRGRCSPGQRAWAEMKRTQRSTGLYSRAGESPSLPLSPHLHTQRHGHAAAAIIHWAHSRNACQSVRALGLEPHNRAQQGADVRLAKLGPQLCSTKIRVRLACPSRVAAEHNVVIVQ